MFSDVISLFDKKDLSDFMGFSLLELLVTTSIIIILSAISIANFENYYRTVYELRVENQKKSIITSIEAFRASYPTLGVNYNSGSVNFRNNGAFSLNGILSTLSLSQAMPGFVHDKEAGIAFFYVLRGTHPAIWEPLRGDSVDLAITSCKLNYDGNNKKIIRYGVNPILGYVSNTIEYGSFGYCVE